jgi:hypothetical protein
LYCCFGIAQPYDVPTFFQKKISPLLKEFRVFGFAKQWGCLKVERVKLSAAVGRGEDTRSVGGDKCSLGIN